MTERNAKQWAYNFSPAEITKPEKCSLKGRRVKEYSGVYAIVAGNTGREKEDAMTRLPFHDFSVGLNKKTRSGRTRRWGRRRTTAATAAEAAVVAAERRTTLETWHRIEKFRGGASHFQITGTARQRRKRRKGTERKWKERGVRAHFNQALIELKTRILLRVGQVSRKHGRSSTYGWNLHAACTPTTVVPTPDNIESIFYTRRTSLKLAPSRTMPIPHGGDPFTLWRE